MEDPPTDARARLRVTALGAWQAGLASAASGPLVARALAALPDWLAGRPRHVLAVGKAAFSMLDGAAAGGWVSAVAVGPAVAPLPSWPRADLRVGAHPVPDSRSAAAAARLRELVMGAPADALLVALISGGASAMVAAPRAGLTLEEKVAITSQVMASGASIAELNRVRRSLSSVKGGQLVAGAAAPVLSLLVSDVAGDDPRVIGSGLTISDEAQPLDCASAAPAALAAGSARGADRFAVLAPQALVADGVAAALAAGGWPVQRVAAAVHAPCVQVAAELARAVMASAGGRCALVAFGEPTVVLPAGDDARPGRGGRAQQLALALARELRGTWVTALVAGTDGVDGPSLPPVAGALVDGESWAELGALGLDGDAALARCDARAALEALGSLIITGPTGRNHADVMILLREA